jgi:hypothetical protein
MRMERIEGNVVSEMNPDGSKKQWTLWMFHVYLGLMGITQTAHIPQDLVEKLLKSGVRDPDSTLESSLTE